MISRFNRLKIPTLLGLGIIIIGIMGGVFLVLRNQTFVTQATPSLISQSITLTNIEEDSVTISWQTSSDVPGFVSYGQSSPNEQTLLDDRDGNIPKPHLTHYVTIKNLLPKTTYQFKIVSGKFTSEIHEFTTSAPTQSQTGFRPVIGFVFDGNKPLEEGIAYLSISQAVTQSSLIKNMGNFLIPLSFIHKADLSEIFPLKEGDIAKITIISNKGQASILLKLTELGRLLPPLKLGQNLDLTNIELEIKEASPSSRELNKFDLNEDKSINVGDYAILLQNFGKGPKDKRADLNSDGLVDQKDLDLMAEQINQ